MNDRRKRRQGEFFEFPTGSFQAIQCAQQRCRRASNGFGGERFRFVRPIFHFARGDGEEQAQMFRLGPRRGIVTREQRTQTRRCHKL